MPSRNRTTSEGTHKTLIRPSSVHMRGISHSPPASGVYYTDSAGSSLSIDEPDMLERVSHAATPDEHTIFEENADDALLGPMDPGMNEQYRRSP